MKKWNDRHSRWIDERAFLRHLPGALCGSGMALFLLMLSILQSAPFRYLIQLQSLPTLIRAIRLKPHLAGALRALCLHLVTKPPGRLSFPSPNAPFHLITPPSPFLHLAASRQALPLRLLSDPPRCLCFPSLNAPPPPYRHLLPSPHLAAALRALRLQQVAKPPGCLSSASPNPPPSLHFGASRQALPL
jgi:hypothetical protein